MPFILIMVGLYTATRFGIGERVTRDVEVLLNRLPIAMRQYIKDYAGAWLPNGGKGKSNERS